jgi:CubicO group peptidase (beta-lactamase class C family)
MAGYRVALIAVCTALCLLQVDPRAQGSSARDPATDADVLGAQRLFSAWAEGQLRARGLPGMAVGVVSDQRLVWATGFGLANINERTPMTPQTKFRMASHSKLFTAIAVMQLRDQGKLRLDDPVSKHRPGFRSPRPVLMTRPSPSRSC